MILTALLSYLAGLLTVLAPCVLPLLPIILGGSFVPGQRSKWRPYVIAGSLAVSLILFTILLKASTVLIGVDPAVWSYVAGGIVILLGLFMLLPELWARIIAGIGFESTSQKFLGKAGTNKNQTASAVLTGFALGPVFSSCSPTYAWVIATVLPANAALGVFYLGIYVLGVVTSLLAIALLGRRLLERIKWASDPKGWFQRVIAVLFILVGLFLITGWDKKVQTWLVDKDYLNLLQLEQKLVPEDDEESVNSQKILSSNVDQPEYFNVSSYPAPEFIGTGEWFNSQPLSLDQLKGKVVLVDFWTYSCINCIRTFPYLKSWYDTYKDQGFVIVGVHAPEFAFEKLPENLQKAIDDNELKYPIVQDNDFKTWQAYNNQFWPAHYLIDKDGQVRREHFGEGEYDQTEAAIRDLLKESGSSLSNQPVFKDSQDPPITQGQTPETYLGYERGQNFANVNEFQADSSREYEEKMDLASNQWSVSGFWNIGGKDSVSGGDSSKLKIKFSAKEVYLVMGGPDKLADVKYNDQPLFQVGLAGNDVNSKSQVKVSEARLYKLFKSDKFIKDGVLEITIPKGVSVNAFTFGG